MKITIRQTIKHGHKRWCVDWKEAEGKRQRRFLSTKAEAQALAQQVSAESTQTKGTWAAFTAKERDQITGILAESRAQGLSLADLWRQVIDGSQNQPRERKALGEAINEVILSKKTANRRPDYVLGLQQYLQAFAAGRADRFIDQISASDIERWFAGRSEAASTRASNLGRLSALFDLAWRRHWITENPCRRVERVTIEARPPQILSPEEAAKILEFARTQAPRALAWFGLTLLAGVRPEEADRLQWSAIDLDRGIVKIDAAASKVRQRRIVHLMPAAIAWLRLARESKANLPLNYTTRRRLLRRVRQRIGWEKWPQDILRHSCASYWLAETQDAARIAHELGNSAAILLRHYRELVTREDAQRFWALRPAPLTCRRAEVGGIKGIESDTAADGGNFPEL